MKRLSPLPAFAISIAVGLALLLATAGCDSTPNEKSPDAASSAATQPASQSAMQIQVYDVRDLLPNHHGFNPTVLLAKRAGIESESKATSEAECGTTGQTGTDSLFDDDNEDDTKDEEEEFLTKAEAVEKLITRLKTKVAPASWEINGGDALIAELNGNLVVTQTAENHRKIEAFLAKRRAEKQAATQPASAPAGQSDPAYRFSTNIYAISDLLEPSPEDKMPLFRDENGTLLSEEQIAEKLVGYIKQHVAPASWGKNKCDIRVIDSMSLVVDQTPENLYKVNMLINRIFAENLNRPTTQPAMRIQVYDIRHLLSDLPNFVGTGQYVVQENPVIRKIAPPWRDVEKSKCLTAMRNDGFFESFSSEPISRGCAVQYLIDCICKQVAPASWSANGGTAHINELNGMLVVTQTLENHQKIGSLLATISRPRTHNITFAFQSLSLPARDDSAFRKWLKTKLGVAFKDQATALVALNKTQAKPFIKKVAGAGFSTQKVGGLTSLFNSDLIFISVIGRDLQPSKEPQKATFQNIKGAAAPVVIDFTSGAGIELQGMLSEDKKSVNLSVKYRYLRLELLKPTPIYSIAELQTRVSCPRGDWLLIRAVPRRYQVAGLKLIDDFKKEFQLQTQPADVSRLAAAQKAKLSDHIIYLLIKPHIVKEDGGKTVEDKIPD